jgi:hypothetical protein
MKNKSWSGCGAGVISTELTADGMKKQSVDGGQHGSTVYRRLSAHDLEGDQPKVITRGMILGARACPPPLGGGGARPRSQPTFPVMSADSLPLIADSLLHSCWSVSKFK